MSMSDVWKYYPCYNWINIPKPYDVNYGKDNQNEDDKQKSENKDSE